MCQDEFGRNFGSEFGRNLGSELGRKLTPLGTHEECHLFPCVCINMNLGEILGVNLGEILGLNLRDILGVNFRENLHPWVY